MVYIQCLLFDTKRRRTIADADKVIEKKAPTKSGWKAVGIVEVVVLGYVETYGRI
jgi:hypothetical protein